MGRAGVNVDVVAGTSANPMMAGYTAGELIHQYTNIGTSYFTSTDGLGTTLAGQVVNGQSYNAVLATETGGRNVHFATEGMLADNNMLAHALDWTTQPASGPQLSLHMSRDKAIVASRVDMDQAMESADVHPATGPGIYDALLPILAQWKAAYNFVGSYYIDIGNNTAQGQTTDWAYSKVYYDQMLAMGNEIGSHSYTHPEDTNLLTAAQFQFEFQQSRQVIEQQLGLTNIGVAVPGAPETIDTARQIAQYYPYISGGASLIGAGYPGAIGYLTPGDMNSVYIAPNTSFDFTLVGFQKLTVEQAEAAWAKEWAALTAHSDLPVIVWPWHDYGPTNWVLDAGVTPPYTTQMFTNFIARAAQAGSEFVTLADLARRVESFEKSTLSYSYDAVANAVTATVGTTGSRPRHLRAGPGDGQHDQERGELVRLRQRQRLRGQGRRQLHDRARRHPGRRHPHHRSGGPGGTAQPDRRRLRFELLDRRRGPCPGRPEGADRHDRPGHGRGQLHPDRRQARSGVQWTGPAQRRGQSGPRRRGPHGYGRQRHADRHGGLRHLERTGRRRCPEWSGRCRRADRGIRQRHLRRRSISAIR